MFYFQLLNIMLMNFKLVYTTEHCSWTSWFAATDGTDYCYRFKQYKFDNSVHIICRYMFTRLCQCSEQSIPSQFCDTFQHQFHGFARKAEVHEVSHNLTMRCISRREEQCSPVFTLSDTAPWCGWSPWYQWSATCGAMKRTRQRLCRCSTLSKLKCNGKYYQNDYQYRKTRCPKVSFWCPWDQWSHGCSCSTTQPYYSRRTRICSCPYVSLRESTRCRGTKMEICIRPQNCNDIFPVENKNNTSFNREEYYVQIRQKLLMLAASLAVVISICLVCKWNKYRRRKAAVERTQRQQQQLQLQQLQQQERDIPDPEEHLEEYLEQLNEFDDVSHSSVLGLNITQDQDRIQPSAPTLPPSYQSITENTTDSQLPTYDEVMRNKYTLIT